MTSPLAFWKGLRRRPGAALAIDVMLIAMVFVLVHSWNTRNLPGGEQVPELNLVLLDSGTSAKSGLPRGSKGVVYFFAPWCFYCRKSIGNLDRLVETGDISWARAVALDYQDLDSIRDFVRETGLSQPVLLGDPKTANDWSIRAFPTYFVISSGGEISSRSVGYSTRLGLWARIKLAR
jgi:thiol-disulfide isomerase/thioredoxin